jgi:hypothetical protein
MAEEDADRLNALLEVNPACCGVLRLVGMIFVAALFSLDSQSLHGFYYD